MKNLILILIIILTILSNIHTQILMNKAWETKTGQPEVVSSPISMWDNIKWTSSVLTGNNDMITIGNTLESPGNTDILLTRYGNNGAIVWERKFAGNGGGYDYGLTVTIDNNGYIFAVGVVTTLVQTTDIVLLKYSPTGSLVWSAIVDGGNNNFDIPTALVNDGNGNIYVVGGTFNLNSQSDWLVAKFNGSGNLEWKTTYDYTNFHELAVGVQIENGDIFVHGFSASSQSSDFVEIKFSATDGTTVNQNRKEIPNLSLEDVLAIANDDQNNMYILGSTKLQQSGSNQDMQIVKINSSFAIEWINIVDAEGLSDKSRKIVLDNVGDIIIAGNSENIKGGMQITLVKYSSNGSQVYRTNYVAPETSNIAEITEMKITNDNDVVLTGTVDHDGDKDLVTMIYDDKGYLKAEKYFSNDVNSEDFAKDLEITSSGEVFIFGESHSTQSAYTSVKYETYKKQEEVELINNEPSHIKNEVIVKFDPAVVNTNFVDDKERIFGSVDEVLTQTTALQVVSNIELGDAIFTKIFPRLTTSHTTSITRLGDSIQIPKFWSAFLIVFSQEIDVNTLVGKFEGLAAIVEYAHPNYVAELNTIPNDPFFLPFAGYEGQSSLHPSIDFPDAHINMEPAWDIETGKDYVKVGVYDQKIYWAHGDFGDGTFSGSQIKGGWDFAYNTSISSTSTTVGSHGTMVAGIIGALRNNNYGIAGIAGGGPDAEGINNPGVQLFSLAVSGNSNNSDADVATRAAAIIEGSMYNPSQNPTGYGLNVQNHSYADDVSTFLEDDAIKFAWRNNCIIIAGRGNDGNDDLLYPACYDDERVINVGYSGNNGEYFDGINGNLFGQSKGLVFQGGSFGGEVDVIAPGSTDNVRSIHDPSKPISGILPSGVQVHPPPDTDNITQQFNGSSASAPHVAGVAALMYSNHHVNQGVSNNLAPEDIEYILQKYSTDIVNPIHPLNYPINYDVWNGWGRVNAHEALRRTNPESGYRIFHSGIPYTTIIETVATNQIIVLPQGIGALSAGQYVADRVRVINTFKNIFNPNITILDGWRRLSSAIGYSQANPVYDDPWGIYDFDIQGNFVDVTVTSYTYNITSASGQTTPWFPAHPSEIRPTYSLHLEDVLLLNNDRNQENKYLTIFPNPNHGQFVLNYHFTDDHANLVQVLDMSGRLISEIPIASLKSGNVSLNIANVASGVYICRVITNKSKIVAKKIVKF